MAAAPSASHGWKGILKGRDLLINHLGKAIGDGESTSVWKDAWIDPNSSLKPLGPLQENDQDLLVADLLSRETKEWNTAKVLNLLPDLASHIVSIRPSIRGTRDSYKWNFHKSGDYTAKSGYLSLQASKVQSTALLLNNGNDRETDDWNWHKCIWSPKLLPKIKMFLWKACQNALPTAENLLRRGIQVPPSCCRCGEPETTIHLLFHCSFAQAVWSIGPWAQRFDAIEITSLKEALILSKGWTSLPPYGHTSNCLPWICWFLWTSRNQYIFENRSSSPSEIFLKSLKAIREWEQAQGQIETPTAIPSSIAHLSPPPSLHPLTLCCNTDAAWRSDSGNAGLAWIFADNEGRELNQGSLFQKHVSSACMAEALAIRSALLHAAELDYKFIWLRSDSQVLIGAISSGRFPTELYGVLSDIAVISSSSFTVCHFSFIKRESNGLADLNAKACLLSGPSSV